MTTLLSSSNGKNNLSCLLLCLSFFLNPTIVEGFLYQKHTSPTFRQSSSQLAFDYNENSDFGEEEVGDGSGSIIEDLNWRVDKLRLEEENTKRFLRAGPRFLPYDDCRKWVQAWGNRWKTKEDWRSWIAQGEKRNAYIPSRPDEYYTKLGDWISWDHFLGVNTQASQEDDGGDR